MTTSSSFARRRRPSSMVAKSTPAASRGELASDTAATPEFGNYVRQGDQLTITYINAPTLNRIPD